MIEEPNRSSARTAEMTAAAERRAPFLAEIRAQLSRMPKSMWTTRAVIATDDAAHLVTRGAAIAHFADVPQVVAMIRGTRVPLGKILAITIGDASGVTVLPIDFAAPKARKNK